MTETSVRTQIILLKSAIQQIFESKSSPEDNSWQRTFCDIASFASKISGIPFDPSVVDSPERMKAFGEKCLQANPNAISCLVYANKTSTH